MKGMFHSQPLGACRLIAAMSSYWKRDPTGLEFIVQSIVGINHGGLGETRCELFLIRALIFWVGVVPWDDPTTTDIKASASSLALALPKLTPFIASPVATFHQILTNDLVDVGMWTVGPETLVLATNTKYNETTIHLPDLESKLFGGRFSVTQVFDSGAKVTSDGKGITFESVGSGGFVVKK